MQGLGGLVYSYNMSSQNVNSSTNDIWVEEDKKIEGDIKCSICLSNIENENKYMTCDTCNKNFMEGPLREWLTNESSCPLCRSEWTNRIIYINK